MIRKYRAVKIAEHGFLTDERNDPIFCPIRRANCTLKCAWFSAEDRVLRCKDTVIGALRGKPMRSFHLHTGPEVYDVDDALMGYDLSGPTQSGN